MLFLGIVVLYGIAATTRYDGLLATFSGATVDPLALSLGLVLLWVGLAFKLGAFPVHPWVPDVAHGAPVPAATFLTIVPKVGALIAFYYLRVLGPMFFRQATGPSALTTNVHQKRPAATHRGSLVIREKRPRSARRALP